MTQPTSVDRTFDTSLIDLNASFSTTESDPSDAGFNNPTLQTPPLKQKPLSEESSQDTPKASQADTYPPPKPSTPIQHIPTQEAYDQWASVYDSDGNMLQSIDDVELSELLPTLLTKVLANNLSTNLNILDLGCGTGRNTTKLLAYAWPEDRNISITGLDFSKGMLDRASSKLSPSASEKDKITLTLHHCDCFPTANTTNPNTSPLPSAIPTPSTHDAIISTLVLEHIPLEPYFATLALLTKPDAHVLVTNMHSEMGRISQAGFINAAGIKVRGHSFAHSPEETVRAAEQAGFEVLGLSERMVEEGDIVEGRVGERGRKWVGVRVWYGVLLRKT